MQKRPMAMLKTLSEISRMRSEGDWTRQSIRELRRPGDFPLWFSTSL